MGDCAHDGRAAKPRTLDRDRDTSLGCALYRPASWPAHLPPSPLPEPDDPSGGFFGEGPRAFESELLEWVNHLRPRAGNERVAQLRSIYGDEVADVFARVLTVDDEQVEQERTIACRYLWWLDLRRLHDHFVPPSCRAHGPDPSAAWDGFFSLCLVYDPPPEDLIEFVEAAPIGVTPPPDLLRRPDEEADDHVRVPLMVNAPVVVVRDTDEVERATRDYYEELLTHLAEALAPDGIDLSGLRQRMEADRPDMAEQLRERRSGAAIRSYIDPTEHSTLEDIKQARVLLRAGGAQSHTKHRNPLLAVQIAIWMDSFGVTVKEIATAFGWTLREDEYGNARLSDRVTDHAKEGRRLLTKRNSAANNFRPERK